LNFDLAFETGAWKIRGVQMFVEMSMTRESLQPAERRLPSRPLCPNCGRSMHLDRVTARKGGLPELRSYKCGECGVWASEAAEATN
jgi:predicted RNA-binding Zn-ribbon protein involved in translation (DUF1610 family)